MPWRVERSWWSVLPHAPAAWFAFAPGDETGTDARSRVFDTWPEAYAYAFERATADAHARVMFAGIAEPCS